MSARPALEVLVRHLAECPPEFLLAPGRAGTGPVDAGAVLADVLVAPGAAPEVDAREVHAWCAAEGRNPGERSLVLLAAWLLSAPALPRAAGWAVRALDWVRRDLAPLSSGVGARRFVEDPERREEFARLCLAALDVLPEGESAEQAQDRLRTVSTLERRRFIEAARSAEARARQVRAELARKAAEEAAAKVSRE